MAAESRGADQADDGPLQNGLEINGQVWGGELSLVWSFDPALYTSAEVNALAAQYERALLTLIQHCDAGECLGLTPSDVPLARLSQAELDALSIPAAQIEDVYPLTPLQQGMLFHELDAPERGTYVNQLDVNVTGLVPERLRAAWQRMLERHAILRSAFVWEDVPHVVHSARADAELRDLRGLSSQEVAPALRELSRAEHARGLPLAQAPLARILIAALPDGSHQLIWTTHHLLLDGWSNARLLAELLAAYEAPDAAAPPAPPFKRYLQWLAERPQAEAERFWREELAQVPGATYLASAAPPCARAQGRKTLSAVVAADVLSSLRALARRERVTLGSVLEAAFGMLLSAYTGLPSVMFGVTVSGRPASLSGAEHMLGLFINTIPSVQRIQPNAPLGEHLRELQRRAAERREHEHTPLNQLARWAGQPGRPLFDSLLVFENYPVSQALSSAAAGSLRFGPTHSVESTDFPLTLSINQGEALALTFEYACDAFDERTASELRDRFVHLLRRLCGADVKRVADLSVLRPEDDARLEALRRVPQGEREHGFVHTWIAQRAAATPHAVAVVCGSERLTFRQLVTRARALAQRLSQLPVGPDDRVGIALPRSTDLLVAVLGVLEACAAYVPLDPGYPSARLQLMAADAGLRALVSTRALSAQLDELSGCERVWIEDVPADCDAQPLAVALRPEHLAYVIYTSGSTGKPKGVAVSHAALSMHLAAAARTYGLGPRDAALHLASISFDAAVEQWAVPLLSGAKLVLHAEGEETPEVLHALALREQVSLLYPPTSLILGLAQHQTSLPAGERRLQLRLCCVGGEAVSRDTLQRLAAAFQPERVINGYGPTETVITPLLWQAYADTPVESAYAPIGSPVGRRSALILNQALEPVAPGLIGELYIAGEGLARGYFEAPRSTAERFLPAPHAVGERMYRTGDLVRLLPSSAVEFVGRADAQIKLRGFRIEPAEIEAALLGLAGVSEAVVALDEAPHRRLVAHVGAQADEAALRAQLQAALPAHLVPARILVLPRLPRTPNGKVDRAALPRAAAAAQGFEPPQGELEEALAQLWCELLSLPRVGRDDNFFELGGDSIVSIQLIGRARKLGWALTTRQVFEHPSLRALGRVVKPLSEIVVEARPEGEVPLTPIQRVFFQQPMAAPAHFNQALLLTPRTALDRAALAGALDHVHAQHDALRLRFTRDANGVSQRYAEQASTAAEVLWQRRAHDRAEIEALCQQAQRSLDLARGPLLRALHIQVDDGSERLLLVVHHLVMDGVSFRILLEDLEGAYRALALSQPAPALLRTSSFQRYAQELGRFAQGEARAALPSWEALLSGGVVRMPRDLPGQLQPLPAGRAHERVLLPRELTEQLLRETAHAYHTRVDDILLCALARTLCAYSGASALPIALEGHGRQELFEQLDLTRTLGWFTTVYPVQLSAAGEPGSALPAVKEQLRALPHQGLSHGALLALGPTDARERLRALPEPQVLFNYLGQLDQSLDAEQGLFVPSAESSGDDTDPDLPAAYMFEVNAEIVAGQLRVEWGYCPALHQTETVRGLVARYEQELRALIEHCRGQRRSTWTPSDVPLAELDQAALCRLSARAGKADDVYRLTPLQQGMLYHALSTPESDVYVTQLAVDLRGLDGAGITQLRAAWQATLDAHESLRTCFTRRDLPHPVQLVEARAELPFEVLHAPTDLLQLAEQERVRGFDLEQAPLMRVTLARTGEGTYRMLWTSHHLLLDGWSSSLLLGEVLERFAGARPAAPLLRFRAYVAWLAARDAAASERYFRAQLAHLPEPSLLGRAVHEASYASVRQTLSPDTCERLEQLARACSGTLSGAVSASWALVLSRALGQPCVAFGSTVSGRPPELRDVERVLGLFINTVPVISTPRAGSSVRQWLQQTAAEQLELREHEHAPLYDIQSWAGFGGPLFDSLMVFENYPVARNLSEQRGALSFAAVGTHETTSYALTIGVSRDESGLAIAFDYQREALEAELVQQLLSGFCHVLTQFASRPDDLLG